MTIIFCKIASQLWQMKFSLCCHHAECSFHLCSHLLVYTFQKTFWHRCTVSPCTITAWSKRLSPRQSKPISLIPSSPSISTLHLTTAPLPALINLPSSFLTSVSLIWEAYVCHDSGETERRQLMERKWNFPAVCWRGEVLSQQPPRCDSSAHSRSGWAILLWYHWRELSQINLRPLTYTHTHTYTRNPYT